MLMIILLSFVIGIFFHISYLYGILLMSIILWKYKERKMIFVFIVLFYFYTSLFSSHPIAYINGKVVSSYDYGCILEYSHHFYFMYTNENYPLGSEIEGKCNMVEMEESGNENRFSFKDYLYSKKVFDMIEIEDPKVELKRNIKQKLIDYIDHFQSPVNSYTKTLLLGVKDEYSRDLYDLASALSLLHLFALSGMHLSIIEKYLKKLHLHDHLIYLILGIYVLIVGDSVSLWRSYLYKALSANKKMKKFDLFLLIALLFLFYNPYVLYSSSFIFSMVISFVIEVTKKMKYANIYPYLSSIPLVLYNSFHLPVLGIIYSYICSDLIEIIFSILLINTCFYGVFNSILVRILKLFENILVMLNDFGLTITFCKVPFLFALLYYFIFYYFVMYRQLNYRYQPYGYILCVLILSFYFAPYFNPTLSITMIDVGQGDCFLVRYPFCQNNILIDTGGSLTTDIASKRIIPYLESVGIKSLDKVMITHDDYDHSGALESLEKHFKVKEVIREGRDFLDFHYIDLGYQMEENAKSLVYLFEYEGKRCLFTGDLPLELEKDVCNQIDQIDYLKVGHHGSNTSTSAYLLEHAKPRIGLISVGKYNKFGHPTKEVLDRLDAYHVKVYRTDQNGMVSIILFNGYEWIKVKND